MSKQLQLIGQRFGFLLVLNKGDVINQRTTWGCLCDCGNNIIVPGNSLTTGNTSSCGCKQIQAIIKASTTHGLSKGTLYSTWNGIKYRCYYKKGKYYKYYGGRGITMCDQWRYDFKAFYDWAMANGWAPELTLEREKQDGNYEPNNCRWATLIEQARNKRSNHIIYFNGENKTLVEWAEIFNIESSLIRYRLKNNWPIERVFSKDKYKFYIR